MLISQNCSCSNSSLPATYQKPPTQGECKSSQGTWVVWDLREENVQHSLLLLFCLRQFLGKSIESEAPKAPAAAVSCAKFALKEVFLPSPALKIKSLFLQTTSPHCSANPLPALPVLGITGLQIRGLTTQTQFPGYLHHSL